MELVLKKKDSVFLAVNIWDLCFGDMEAQESGVQSHITNYSTLKVIQYYMRPCFKTPEEEKEKEEEEKKKKRKRKKQGE